MHPVILKVLLLCRMQI